MFETDAKGFYRILTEKPNGNAAPPSKDDVETFWPGIWEETRFYNKDASWLQSEVDAANGLVETMEHVQGFSKEDLCQTIKNMGNWKSPGVDKIQIYWIKKLTALHSHLAKAVNKILENPMELPEWLTRGITYLLPKAGDSSLAKNYRPITCLPVMYKLIHCSHS